LVGLNLLLESLVVMRQQEILEILDKVDLVCIVLAEFALKVLLVEPEAGCAKRDLDGFSWGFRACVLSVSNLHELALVHF